MTFRTRTLLRLIASIVTALVLTGLALLTVPTDAQPTAPLFVNTTDWVYAVYPQDGRVETLSLVGLPLNMRLSPDGAWLLVDVQPVLDAPGRDFYVVETATLDITPLMLSEHTDTIAGVPLWRWDSAALLYVEQTADGARVVEYQLDDATTRIVVPHIPLTDDIVPRVVWWSEAGFALLHAAADRADLLPFAADGASLPPFPIYTAVSAPDAPLYLPPFTDLRLADVGAETWQLAVYRPGIDRWDVVSPLTGTVKRLSIGVVMVDVPVGLPTAHFAVLRQPGASAPLHANIAVRELLGRRPLFSDGQGIVTVSPDGAFYTSGDFIGLAVSDGTTRTLLDIPAAGTQLHQWQVAWSPLVARATLLGRYRGS